MEIRITLRNLYRRKENRGEGVGKRWGRGGRGGEGTDKSGSRDNKGMGTIIFHFKIVFCSKINLDRLVFLFFSFSFLFSLFSLYFSWIRNWIHSSL